MRFIWVFAGLAVCIIVGEIRRHSAVAGGMEGAAPDFFYMAEVAVFMRWLRDKVRSPPPCPAAGVGARRIWP